MNFPAAVARHNNNQEETMSWTIDARCSQCGKKATCPDKAKLIGTLSPLTNDLNTQEPHVSGPGDGIIILHCNDFSVSA